MSMGTIGVEVTGSNASESVEQIQRLEDFLWGSGQRGLPPAETPTP